ncbi:putative Acyl-CoA synthetase family member 4 [Cinnamomum micranthum f. kanehirae]|uniref:Putative Acyl-CoA synthetase family member 4 n=1 Tax=Cinnamomum micranthum f. kanehirae TaxID=337451 RepID=A0A443NHS9_9MAGN|nr:putative Acyl-CoA synthetase family member 4 [Cinnamomum micranthum f. kanehirae]
MTTELSEITDLFTRLAFHLQLQRNSSRNQPPLHIDEEEDLHIDVDEEEAALALAISSLNKSLNFNTTSPSSSSSSSSRVRVLDTALSLMCFKAPDLCNSSIECLAETILALLSSSISCKVSRFPNQHESLQVGSSISAADCPKLIEACADVIGSLEGSGKLSYKLFCAVLKVATSACLHPSQFPSSIVYKKSRCKRNTAISKLYSFAPDETVGTVCEMPLRLLFWYLDPLTLKDDISRILREVVERPFLCLKKELHERMAWRSIMICLVTSPTIFMETRALLHAWFLVTGLASILELCIELVSSALDVLSRPMWWETVVYTKKQLGPMTDTPYHDFRQTSINPAIIDHKSTWAMLMDFPAWFYFAVMLLFSEKHCQGIFPSSCTKQAVETKKTSDSELCGAAARYLAWILSPVNGILYDRLVCFIAEISGSWTVKKREADNQKSQCYLDTCTNDSSRRRKLKKPRNHNSVINDYNVHGMELWLKDFHHCYVQYHTNSNVSHKSNKACNNSTRPNLLFRRIPLGIMIGSSSCSDDKGNELLLHYSATGEILTSNETKCAGNNHIKWKSGECDNDHLHKCSDEDNERKGAIAGASLVFNLFDIIEDMSGSMLECEDSQRDFVCQVKCKAVKYLVKCIEKLLRLPNDEGRLSMFMDLSIRLERWRRQGREVFEGSEVLTDVIRDLHSKISPSRDACIGGDSLQ